MTRIEEAEGESVALPFQTGVDRWMDACFGDAIKADRMERADRFIEEALELAQTEPAFTADRAHALVDYVFDRPVGDPVQEVGGVMVTLAALCNTSGVDINAAAEAELARVWTKVEQIRAKQAAKPTGSALPIARPTPPATQALVDALREIADAKLAFNAHPVGVIATLQEIARAALAAHERTEHG